MEKKIKNSLKDDSNFVEGILISIFLIFAITSLLEEKTDKSRKKIKKILEDSDNGFENDREMLSTDWQNIRNDFNKSYKKLRLQENE